MTFYQELQLNQAGSKSLIKSCATSGEKLHHTLVYLFKIFITMVFCVPLLWDTAKFSEMKQYRRRYYSPLCYGFPKCRLWNEDDWLPCFYGNYLFYSGLWPKTCQYGRTLRRTSY